MFEVKHELATTRLLTLTGAGGSGKTRLALRVARDLIEAYPDGVWLVELAPLSEETLVPKAVAEALKVPERPSESLSDTLADVLGSRQLLLVLDNCEHLVGGLPGLWTSCSTRALGCGSWQQAAKHWEWRERRGGSWLHSRRPSEGVRPHRRSWKLTRR